MAAGKKGVIMSDSIEKEPEIQPDWKMHLDAKTPLKDWLWDDLREVLNHNEEVDVRLLAAICSEVLRRQLSHEDMLDRIPW